MQFHVEDMTCGGCVRSVTAAILEIDARARIEADPPTRKLIVDTTATAADIQKALAEAGFSASLK